MTDHEMIRPESEQQTPAFDYSGFDSETVCKLKKAERTIVNALENCRRELAEAVHTAHETLSSPLFPRGNNGTYTKKDATFYEWCASLGMTRKFAWQMLNYYNLLNSASPEEQKLLEQAPATLVYEAGKKSAPQELVEQVKRGEIRSLAEYKDKEKELAEARESLMEMQKAKCELEKQLEGSRTVAESMKSKYQRLTDENRKLRDRIAENSVDPQELDSRVKQELAAQKAKWEEKDYYARIESDRYAYDAVIFFERILNDHILSLKSSIESMKDEKTKKSAMVRVFEKLEAAKEDVRKWQSK